MEGGSQSADRWPLSWFWVRSRKTAVTLLCVEVIFTVTTAKHSVTLWHQPLNRRNDLFCPQAEQHNNLQDRNGTITRKQTYE